VKVTGERRAERKIENECTKKAAIGSDKTISRLAKLNQSRRSASPPRKKGGGKTENSTKDRERANIITLN